MKRMYEYVQHTSRHTQSDTNKCACKSVYEYLCLKYVTKQKTGAFQLSLHRGTEAQTHYGRA